MIWHYFPIGMRFPVSDFSEATRKACWRIALSAVYASDPCGTGLYEACESFDPISNSPVYICIVCYVGIKQSRASGECLHKLDRLMTRLCMHNPLVQANYLESFGPYPILAEIDTKGEIKTSEIGAAFLPTEPIVPMQPTNGSKLLIAVKSEKDVCDAEQLARALGTAAADHGFHVSRMQIADGGEGTVRALVAGASGRYDAVCCEDLNGDRVNMTVGVIPDAAAVIEAADAVGASRKNEHTPSIERRSSFGVGTLIKKALDLGYRKIRIGLGDSITADLGLGALSALGVRFLDADGAPVEPCPETLSEIIRIDREALDPRIAQTELTLLYDDAAPLCATNGIGTPADASDEQIHAWERESVRLAQMLGGDPKTPGSGAAGGLGFALASIGGTLQCGSERIRERIGLPLALQKADYVITNDRTLEKSTLMRENPTIKDVLFCPIDGEPNNAALDGLFEHTILPAIGKGVANTAVL